MVKVRALGARVMLAIVVVAGLLGFGAVNARADDPIAERLEITGELAANGTLVVNEVLTFAAGAPSEVVQRLAGQREATNGSYYEFSYSNISAKADGADLGAKVATDGTHTVITVPTSGAKGKPITISYTVTGAVVRDPQGNPFVSWRMLQGLSVQVNKAEGTLNAPAIMTSVDCTSGPPNAVTKCGLYAGGTHDHPQPYFADGPRGVGEAINLDVSYPAGQIAINEVVKHRWSLDRAFSVNLATVLGTLGALALGGGLLTLLHRRFGVDQSTLAPTLVAEFAPVAEERSVFRVHDGVRPGHIGTVADERVDPIDVTGTLLDLAVRGHLLIRELPSGPRQPLDWAFDRLDSADELLPFERRLLDAVAPVGGGVTVSTMAAAVAPIVPAVQSDLYDEVVERGWFERRPDSTRSAWGRIGWIAVLAALLATAVLVGWTTWGLLGLALIALALGLVWVSERMPRRTARGSALLGGLAALAGALQTQPTDRMPAGREYEELSKILPYAVVLGGKDRWLDALVAADDDEDADPDDLTWYHAPGDWYMRDLPAAIHSFVTTVQGELFSR